MKIKVLLIIALIIISSSTVFSAVHSKKSISKVAPKTSISEPCFEDKCRSAAQVFGDVEIALVVVVVALRHADVALAPVGGVAALVVVAAVVTTVLTAGAAASIWIPVLVTAGAGLVGMGLTAAIKGGPLAQLMDPAAGGPPWPIDLRIEADGDVLLPILRSQ